MEEEWAGEEWATPTLLGGSSQGQVPRLCGASESRGSGECPSFVCSFTHSFLHCTSNSGLALRRKGLRCSLCPAMMREVGRGSNAQGARVPRLSGGGAESWAQEERLGFLSYPQGGRLSTD